MTLADTVKRAVLRQWRKSDRNLTHTALELGISRQTLLNYLDRWGLKVEKGTIRKRWLPEDIRAERTLNNRFSTGSKRKAWGCPKQNEETAYEYERRTHLEQQRGGGYTEFDAMVETLTGHP